MRGLYVYGTVGRGKTWLCDAFFASAATASKRRVHLHDLLQDLHRALWLARTSSSDVGSDSPDHALDDAAVPATRDVAELAIDAMLGDLTLLYIDEFHVHDPADAVLLTRVLRLVLERGILLIATSNDAPHDLLPSGEFHALIEPAIALIEEHLDVVELGGSIDYRRVDAQAGSAQASGFASGFWMTEAELDEHSPADLRRPTADELAELPANGHTFTARRIGDGSVWFHFDDLCEAHTSLADFLVWADEFHTWVIEALPPLAAASPQARQRFAHLIDVLVDRDATLHVVSDSSRSEFARHTGQRDAERLHSRLALLRTAPIR